MKALPILIENSPMLKTLALDIPVHDKMPDSKTSRSTRSKNRRRVKQKINTVAVKT